MADAYDLESKITRAFKALIDTLGQPVVGNTYAGLDANVDRAFPNTTVAILPEDEGRILDGQPGNYHFPRVSLIFRDAALAQPSDADPNAALVAAQQRFSATMGLLMMSDDQTTLDYTRRALNTAGRNLATVGTAQGMADNSDMANFTIIFLWEGSVGSHQKVGEGSKKNGGGTFYERVLTFELIACNANID